MPVDPETSERPGGVRHWMAAGDGGLVVADGLPPGDRGFRYGMHVFETILVRGGRPVFLAAHLGKLRRAIEAVGFGGMPWGLPAGLDGFLSGVDLGSGVLRVHVTAGDGAPDDPVTNPRVLVTAEPRPPLRPPPAPAVVVSAGRGSIPEPSGVKSGNYWGNVRAHGEARRSGADEALLFTPDGMLLGAAFGNVFLSPDGEGWVTPAAASGRRAGVVHDWIVPRLGAVAADIPRDVVARARCLLLSNSWTGPRPVGRLDGRALDGAVAMDRLIDDYWTGIDG